MPSLKEQIAEIKTLDSARTKGTWYKDISRSISSVHEGKRLKVTNQDWFEDKDKCVKHDDVDFIVAAPKMAEIIKKLEEIISIQREALTKYADDENWHEVHENGCFFPAFDGGSEIGKEALEKTKQLMEGANETN